LFEEQSIERFIESRFALCPPRRTAPGAWTKTCDIFFRARSRTPQRSALPGQNVDRFVQPRPPRRLHVMQGEAGDTFAVPMTRPLPEIQDHAWLEAFRRGDRPVMEECYRRYYSVVESAIGTVLGVADRETVIHEVFFRLLAEPDMRLSFEGPSLGAWLAAVARNRALDISRRLRRESLVPDPLDGTEAPANAAAEEDAVLRVLLENFRRLHVTPEWAPVFEARFVRQMTQREAARYLGIRRTTLAYRELQLRRRFKKFMLEAEE
jgi:RNA polymerase sigma-70 factor, ECF subfamily